jgi:hypothetical protein
MEHRESKQGRFAHKSWKVQTGFQADRGGTEPAVIIHL